MEFTHSPETMLKCDRSDYVSIYLRICLHSFFSIGATERSLLTFTALMVWFQALCMKVSSNIDMLGEFQTCAGNLLLNITMLLFNNLI